MHLLYVYGTLKIGLGNNHYLENSKYGGKTRIPITSFGGNGVPFINIEKGKYNYLLLVEKREVNDDTLKRIDQLEGHPNRYKRIKMGKGWIYINKDIPEEKDDWTILGPFVGFKEEVEDFKSMIYVIQNNFKRKKEIINILEYSDIIFNFLT